MSLPHKVTLHSLIISGSEKEFYLRAHDEESAEKWVKALKKAVECAKRFKVEGAAKQPNSVLEKSSYFWKV